MIERGIVKKLICDETTIEGASKTHQSFSKDADINYIMSRYAKTGVLVDPLRVDLGRQPRFGDFSDIGDFTSVVNRITAAQNDFMTLPAATRAKFKNDVALCLEFVADPKNLVEAVGLGLLPKELLPKPPQPGEVPPAVPPTGGELPK